MSDIRCRMYLAQHRLARLGTYNRYFVSKWTELYTRLDADSQAAMFAYLTELSERGTDRDHWVAETLLDALGHSRA